MSWVQKLCDVYDAVVDTQTDLIKTGFTQKNIKYHVILSSSGEFVRAESLPENEQSATIPSTAQAEGRTGKIGQPFPLAEKLEYFVFEEGEVNQKFEKYIEQLEQWSRSEGAPECLTVLLQYLKKKTLYADLSAALKPKSASQKDKGLDQGGFVCFSVEDPWTENRLWLNENVKKSWSSFLNAQAQAEQTALCYASGRQLPVQDVYPKFRGNAKLISAEDAKQPFRYKGRFTDDGSAATVSASASERAHHALDWLLKHQGLSRYGMYFVGWNAQSPELDENDEEEQVPPDTFEHYINALFKSIPGSESALEAIERESDSERLKRINEIIIMGLQAATPGRMSIIYYQEMPGNLFAKRVKQWNRECQWEMLDKDGQGKKIRSATWMEICEAVMGADDLQNAKKDSQASHSATKYMQELQLRLLHCAVNGAKLPESMVRTAFNRVVQPMSFAKSEKQKYPRRQWEKCVATTCAMIRKHMIDQKSVGVEVTLDVNACDRDYLYGRLFAVACKLETDATQKSSDFGNVFRLMNRFVLRPFATWPTLYLKLIPYLDGLDNTEYYQRLFGQIESLFRPEDRVDMRSLSYRFLIGYSAQTRELWLKKEERQPIPPIGAFAPPQNRDELFGCLLAVADTIERYARQNSEEQRRSSNALRLIASFVAAPVGTWRNIHDKLIPYLEASGTSRAHIEQNLLRAVERRFREEDRLSDARLGSLFLHGFLRMRLAQTQHDGLDWAQWTPGAPRTDPPKSREAAFAALLALENDIERRALDLNNSEEENRPSNAMRFMARASQRPNEVWSYLRERMKPYEKKAWLPTDFQRQTTALYEWICSHGWNTDTPLSAEYVYYYYLYSQR